ncbi:MAG: glutamate formimidoyltransferase [Prolixibacteraceae bacterium]|jgi:glutamate formiminotransferase/formiminotetrahydrofolate cyclodeaminase|nr:glutamate formimidoyltransferase [Prolixibacteraceae bacterium]
MKQIIECVPNFSEGRELEVIRLITEVIEKVQGIKLLNVDPGYATNRTVVTFAGEPEIVVEAAFQAIKKASELIDMRHHTGEHPRFGATDVCPLVPVSGITMEETVEYARALAKRVGEELQIPVYCYEQAAFEPKRQSLANCRSGEYEGLPSKIVSKEWKPDFGPAEFNARSGAVAIGARNFLIAYNINLNTTSVRRANSIAFDVREAGRILREGDPFTGKIVNDKNGEPIRIPGTLKKVRAIGWYIKEYRMAQISMNLTDITVTPVHVAFDEVCNKAAEHGIRVTGSELIGVVPLQCMLDAGKYFLHKQNRSSGIPDEEIIEMAVHSLGLGELAPFDPQKRIIEYLLRDELKNQQADHSLRKFTYETASDSPAPGGGSISAAVGALGAALGSMVANLSAHKRGWDERWEEFSNWAEKGKIAYEELLFLVDEDTRAFNLVMEAFGLPKENPDQKEFRRQAIQEATLKAIEVPFRVMKVTAGALEMLEKMAEIGNPNSSSDAAVGALCLRTAVSGACLNVRINAVEIKDPNLVKETLEQAGRIEKEVIKRCEQIQKKVLLKISAK